MYKVGRLFSRLFVRNTPMKRKRRKHRPRRTSRYWNVVLKYSEQNRSKLE